MLVLENGYLINAEWAFRWGGGQWAESNELPLGPGAGRVPTQRRAFTVPTLLLFYLLSSVLLHFTIHLLCSISWPIILLCTLAVGYQSSLPLNSSLLLIRVFVTCSTRWAFSKTCKKLELLVWRGCENCRVGCEYKYDCTWLNECFFMWLHVHHSLGETWGSLVTCMTREGVVMSFKAVSEQAEAWLQRYSNHNKGATDIRNRRVLNW